MLMTLATTALAADEPKAADGDAPLPVGWPSGTKPGVIEVKNYPAYRSAVARAKGATTRSDGVLFFSLFNHISRKDIAMTAPVVNTYDSAMIDDPRKQGDLSMEFLYQSPTQGQAGQGVGAVKVEDHPAATFVCRGVQGEMNPERLKIEMDEVKKWLTDHKGEWEQAGEPRRLGYHGPMTPVKKRLWEVQIPIRKVGSAK
jgi:hypothetical protein